MAVMFAGPVHQKEGRPKGGAGEAAYWVPILAMFTGALRHFPWLHSPFLGPKKEKRPRMDEADRATFMRPAAQVEAHSK